MNIRQYLYVSTLARELNFTHAAEVLGIAQPTLSQFIKKLEKEIGTELFLRNGSDVRLTEAGRIFIEHGQKLINLQHSMEDALLDIAEDKRGELRLALSPCRCDTLMPELVTKFRQRYPGITVSICETLAGSLLRGIDEDDFTIGVTPMPHDASGYVCKTVLREEILVAVPKGSVIDARLAQDARREADRLYPAIDFALLNGADFIVMQEWQVMQQQLMSLCEDCGIEVFPAVECTNNRTMITMVQEGIGCTLLPDSIIGEAEKKRFDRVSLYSIRQEIPMRRIVALYRKNKKLNKPAQYMLALLTERNGN